MKRLNILFLLLLLFVASAIGQQIVQPDSVRIAAWDAFKEREGESWNIRWDEQSGLPRTIVGGLTKEYRGEAETAARAFLTEYANLFALKNDLSDLQHRKTRYNRGVYHVTFDQYYGGIRVERAEYRVHVRENGRIDMANGFYYPNVIVSTTPSVSMTDAVRITRIDLDIPLEHNLDVNSELVVYPKNEDFRLAWRLILFSKDPFIDWKFWIDAHTGEVISKYHRLTHVTGTGNVYPTHPGLSSVTTEDLFRLTGDGTLTGTYVTVENDEAPNAFSANHNFQYSTSSTHFDEVNLYYHVDNFRHYYIANLGSLGFTNITAHAHAVHPNDGDLNAWFSRSTRNIYFGDASSNPYINNFAREDKVIYHEYGHAVIYDLNSGIRSWDNEEGAISEGVPDYWAGAHKDRSRILDYVLEYFPASQRDMADPQISSYDEYQIHHSYPDVPAHDGGEFFSAVLWDLRSSGDINPAQADFLVFDAIHRVSGTPDFLEFRDGMMAADNNAYSGSHNDLIQDTFAARGIGDFVPLTVNISGPGGGLEGTSDTYSANVSDGTSPYSYQWYYRHETECSSCWTFVGSSQTYYHTYGPPSGEYLRVVVTDSESRSGENQMYITTFGMNMFQDQSILAEFSIPEEYSLSANYPNPFNPVTTIRYELPEPSHVTLTIYDMMGREVRRLINDVVQPGYHTATWDSRNEPDSAVSSGMYIYRFTATPAGGESEFTGITKSNTMLLVK